jgi:hypothetical protein
MNKTGYRCIPWILRFLFYSQNSGQSSRRSVDHILITTAQDDGHSSQTKYNLITWGTLEMRLRNFVARWGKQILNTLHTAHILHAGYTGCFLGLAFSSFPVRIPVRPSSILTDFFVVSFSLLKNIWKHVSHCSQLISVSPQIRYSL